MDYQRTLNGESRPTGRDYARSSLGEVRANMTKTGHVSQTLEQAALTKIYFDPMNAEHRAAYLAFLRNGRWTMRFHSEWPCVSVPATIEKKLLEVMLHGYEDRARAQLSKVYPGEQLREPATAQ